jgi:nicotinamidase-related amidase
MSVRRYDSTLSFNRLLLGDAVLSALILIDLQPWIVETYAPEGGPAAVLAGADARRACRAAGIPTVLVRHGDPDAAPAAFAEPITPAPGEPVLTKHSRSAFAETGLGDLLRAAGIDRVVLAGLVTEGGILSTADDALRLGYPTAVLLPAIAGNTPEGHHDTLADLQQRGVELLAEWP